MTPKETKIFSVIPITHQALLDDLLKSRFQPGERLPGDRELAKLYGIGRSSMVKVLKQLEAERYIERIPVFGTFVRKDLKERIEPLVITVASMDVPEQTGINNPFAWEATSEMLRGLINECSKHRGIHLNWYCCPESSNKAVIQHQIEDLLTSDGIIFNGCGMEELKGEILRFGKPALTIDPKLQYRGEPFPVVDYDRWGIFPDYPVMLSKKYPDRPIVLLSYKIAECDKAELNRFRKEFNQIFELCNREVHEVCLPTSSSEYGEVLNVIKENLPKLHLKKKPLLLALNRALVPPLYGLLRETNPEIPIAALIGGNCIESLHAGIPHWREPYFEMGTAAIRLLVEHLRTKKHISNQVLAMEYCCKTESIN